MIKISLKGLAKFMVANSSQQRKILEDFKNPDPEGLAQATYYREALDSIKSYHRNHRTTTWLTDKSNELKLLASHATGQTRSRLLNNARAVQDYLRYFGKRKFELLGDFRYTSIHWGVRVSIVSDLHVMESGKEKIIKLDFSKDKLNPKIVRIISQLLFQSGNANGLSLTSAQVLYVDVGRGTVHKGARAGSRLVAEVDDACKNIADLWDGI